MFNVCCLHFDGSDNIAKQKIQPHTCQRKLLNSNAV